MAIEVLINKRTYWAIINDDTIEIVNNAGSIVRTFVNNESNRNLFNIN